LKDSTIITCAVTGNHTTRAQNPNLPVTPEEIANSCLEAGEAGAAIVHIHVRDPQTGAPSMNNELYAEVVKRIRAQNSSLIINLTTGPGARYEPSEHDPAIPGPTTELLVPERRAEHVALIKPDIATLDLNTMIFGAEVCINAIWSIRRMAAVMKKANVRPEIELFDSGDVAIMHDLMRDGTIAEKPLCSIVMGVKYGFQPSPETLFYARGLLPEQAIWTAFGTGRSAFPMAAQSVIAGGNVRVGFEDSVYLSKGVLAASNAEMVAKASRIIEDLGSRVASSDETRTLLRL
jgi:uncharacterized protein (DUF849 family)